MLPRVPLAACLERWAGEEAVEGYDSAAAGHRTRALRRSRLASFPPFLLVQLRRRAPPRCCRAQLAAVCYQSVVQLPASRHQLEHSRHMREQLPCRCSEDSQLCIKQ